MVVLRPALANAQASRGILEPALHRRFRDSVDLSIIALIVTGVIITFDRLSSAPITTTYFVVLGLKITAAIAMFLLARDLGTRLGRVWRPKRRDVPLSEPSLAEPSQRGRFRRFLSPSYLLLGLGLVAFFLSMLLVQIFEKGTGGV